MSDELVPIGGYLWNHQEGESLESYKVFSIYRDMGQSRSIMELTRHPDVKVVFATIQRWRLTHDWENRIAAYDDFHGHALFRDMVEKQRQLLANEYAAFERMNTYWKRCWNNFTGDDPDDTVEKMNLGKLIKSANDIFLLGRRSIGLPERVIHGRDPERELGGLFSAEDLRKAEEELIGWKVERSVIEGRKVESSKDEEAS